MTGQAESAILWTPSEGRKASSALRRFAAAVGHGTDDDYTQTAPVVDRRAEPIL